MAARKRKTQKLFAEVKSRNNDYGRYYNARFADGVDSIPSLQALEEALNIVLNRDNPVKLRARGDGVPQKSGDHIGSVWVDLFPKLENPFKAAKALKAEQAQKAEGGAS